MAVEELELGWLAQRAEAEEAFESFLLRHDKMVLRTAWRMLGKMEDAQDAAQEVFLRAYKHYRELEDRHRVEAWLYRVTMNVCYDFLRKRRPETGEFPELWVSPNQHESLDAARRKQALLEALQRLPAKERAAVVLRDIEGLGTAEVAEILNSSETTVRSQISVARGKLRKWLEGVVS